MDAKMTGIGINANYNGYYNTINILVFLDGNDAAITATYSGLLQLLIWMTRNFILEPAVYEIMEYSLVLFDGNEATATQL